MICRTHRFSGVEDAEREDPAMLKVLNVEVQLRYSTPRRRWVDLPVGQIVDRVAGKPAGCRFSATAACVENYVNTNPDVRLWKTGTRFVYRFSVDSLQMK